MHTPIFVNLPVADVDRSRALFTELGYSFNEAFCNDKTIVVVLADNLFAMLMQRDSSIPSTRCRPRMRPR
ncbi:VOC family protein [Mycolicibacterium baixiangningiae]|uniref:VOC family protein n=1 Tax=Mycolicibacterium baixiangningiae TaxID=2761578 RepID=UPI001D031779|nr:hypothetical protein [Mycolicibacterium baixiangningiae]